MNTTDFNELIDRRGSHCCKWDSCTDPDVIPLWIADMDYRAAEPIRRALQRRMDHGVFGYSCVPDEFYEAAIEWFRKYHGWTIRREWMLYTTGVVPAISATIKALAAPGEKVLVQTPVYNCFFSSIRNQGCQVEMSPLAYLADAEGDGGQPTYAVDWEDFERRCADPAVKLFLLCNPHNPAGRVWTRGELERMAEVCLRHGVTILADEIHCEMVYPDHDYTPIASISEACRKACVTFLSPSKSFNIAGLQVADIVCDNAEWRQRIDRAINQHETCDLNPFAVEAQIAAYTEGRPWIEQLNAHHWENYQLLLHFFRERLPQLPVTRLEGTYLPWVNITSTGETADELCERLLRDAKVRLNPGTMYGPEGKDFIRINIACPRSRLQEALERIAPHL